MSLQIDERMLFSILQFLSYMFSWMIGTMLSGITLTIDKNGKIRDSSGKFIGFWRQIIFLLLDAALTSILATLASKAIQTMIYQNIDFIGAIVSGMLLIFILWFCHSFSYRIEKHWKAIAILVFVMILNIILVK